MNVRSTYVNVMETRVIHSVNRQNVINNLKSFLAFMEGWECFNHTPEYVYMGKEGEERKGCWSVEVVRFDSAHERTKYLREHNEKTNSQS